MKLTTLFSVVVLMFPSCVFASGYDYDQPPIKYSVSKPNDVVAHLQERVDGGKTKLNFDAEHGYLESFLRELKVPVSSQMLVFSKTSFQRNLITPQAPRALYFNDDVYVGWVQGGSVLEIAAMDGKQGMQFYALEQKESARPRIVRQTHECLQCHDSTSFTGGVPGVMVRSVFTERSGLPMLAAGGFKTNHESPIKDRWGGWYVTGTHGEMRHMGNVIAREEEEGAKIDREVGANLTNLSRRIETSPYLSPHSDIVALMVLEHQVGMHNAMTRASYLVRGALKDEVEMDRALKRKSNGTHSESTISRIKNACEPLVKYMLFANEAKLEGPIAGTSDFAKEFAASGPVDKRGRSLREFDLKTRMFKYPCSYLIYSEAFDGLPAEAKDYIYQRLWEILHSVEMGPEFGSLATSDRQTLVQILQDTKKGLPGYWQAAGQ